jgi:hypothetical protein
VFAKTIPASRKDERKRRRSLLIFAFFMLDDCIG